MKHTYRILLTVIAILMLHSCGLYRKYEREDLYFVDSLYRRMSVPSDSVSSAAVTWECFFTDTLLQEWIHTGLSFNTDINLARLKVREAQASLLEARWALLPGADFTAQGGLPGSSPPVSVQAGRPIYSAACATPTARLRRLWNRAKPTGRQSRPSLSPPLQTATTLS